MQAEVDSLLKNHTWTLVPQLRGKNIVKCRWVHKTKFTSKVVVENHKARLVTKCLSQQEGIEYTKTFAHVVNINFVQIILSLSTRFVSQMYQMDVKSAFLHRD